MHIKSKNLFLCSLVVASCSVAHANQIWQINGGTASMAFMDSNLEGMGFRVSELRGEVGYRRIMAEQHNFAISPFSGLRFETHNGRFVRFLDGTVAVQGGFVASGRGVERNYVNFEMAPNGEASENGFILAPSGHTKYGDPNVLDISNVMVNFDWETKEFMLGMGDMNLSRSFAEGIALPEAQGHLIGVINMMCKVQFVGGDPKEHPTAEREQKGRATIDVGLSAMSGLQQTGHSGTFPTGRAGFAMSTTSCGLGPDNIPWFQAMNVNHPVIVQNLYRTSADGKFEQVGAAYLKHGFFATNSSGCGTCQNPGTGSMLGPGCSDTYGVGNNSDPNWLGPRSEVNPFTGVWTCTGSLFSNFLPDCVDRRSTSTSGQGSVNRRIVVQDADMNVTGASYVYEGYYVTQSDVNKYNQIGWRRANLTWSSSTNTWNVSTTTAMVLGPAIQSWAGSTQVFAQPRSQGDVIAALKTTDLGSGRFLYDYAVYVHDLDRQIREFTLPLESGLSVSNVVFHDPDTNSANNWNWEYTHGHIRFYTSTFAADPNANALSYGNVFNFRFEVNSVPTTSNVNLGLFKPDPNSSSPLNSLSAALNGPLPPQPITLSGTVTLGDWVGGAQNVTMELVPTWGDPSDTHTVSVAADGSWSLSTTDRGPYDLYVKGSHWLRKLRAGHISIGAVNISGINVMLINGDCDNDNEVGPGDFGVLSSAYGSVDGDANWNASADLDGDGEVGPNDFGIISSNYNQIGD